MSIKALSDYTYYSRYPMYLPEQQRRETWNESVSRVFDMHRVKFKEQIDNHPELAEAIDWAESMQQKKRVLASQRSLQFAAEPILKKNLKMFNCATTYVDRKRVFAEIMYSLLCGAGVGFSVQKFHIHKIGDIEPVSKDKEKTFQIPDSIEGWAEAVNVLLSSYYVDPEEHKDYKGVTVKFDYSLIRPEGSLIANRYSAPGPNGLRSSLEKIRELIERRLNSKEFTTDEFKSKLRPIDAYDIIMHISDSVLSGGVRRSATIALFSHDDKEMLNAKTGDWYIKNPQRGRSNNSAALLKGHVTKEEFAEIMKSTREFGEPGFVWVDDLSIIYNPCVEIGMRPATRDGRSGWQVCNLTEINGKFCSSKEAFFEACRASAIIGTLQAGYTDDPYLRPEAKEIFEDEALLGCSITGFMDNPEILFNPKIQREGAELIKEINAHIANMIGINPAARTTCVKPAGSTSAVLGTASGIHPHHAKRYIRRTQVNKAEFLGKIFQQRNPLAVEESVWSANKTDNVISFLCEVPKGAITKNQIGAVELLEKVKLTQQNWVEAGTRQERCFLPCLRHNVSNTVTIKDAEWGAVEDFIFDNQQYFAGISLLATSGDLDYPQAPFSSVMTPYELVKEYGDASVFASGLIVDGQHAFDNDLWGACATVLGMGAVIEEHMDEPEYPKKRTDANLANYFQQREVYSKWEAQKDWVRRVHQFAYRYFADDLRKATYCMKHVSLWKTWCDLKREYVDIDWSKEKEVDHRFQNANELGAQACAGGKCEII